MAKDRIKEAAEELAPLFMAGRSWSCKADYDTKRTAWASEIEAIIRLRVPVSEEWISVETKLPERPGTYSVLDAEYANCQAIFNLGHWRADIPGREHPLIKLQFVTHWRPLPPPPSAGKPK